MVLENIVILFLNSMISALLRLKSFSCVFSFSFGMPPKKVMKKDVKKKHPLSKGKAAKGKSALAKGKAAKKPQTTKSSLTKGRLNKMGKLSLKEKVAMATEQNDTWEEAAVDLKSTLDKGEHSRIWSKHNTFLKNHPEEKGNFGGLSKKEKGISALVWFLKNEPGSKFLNVQCSVENSETLTKGEHWKSERAMLKEFTPEEFQAHLASGRILWRNDPWTHGVYNYCDQGDLKKTTLVKRARTASIGHERELDDETETSFNNFWGKGASAHLQEAGVGFKGRPSLTKGGSNGKGGKGHGKTRKGQLAIENGDPDKSEKEEPTEEELWNQAMVKAQKCKDQCVVTLSNFEEAVQAANKASRLTKSSKRELELQGKDMQVKIDKLKALLQRKKQGMGLEEAKDLVCKAAERAKDLKDETKELKAMANKTYSKASTKK